MKELEKQLRALANERRLLIVKLLRSRPQASVGEIAKYIKLSFRSTSKHLHILYSANIVEKTQRATTVNYALVSGKQLWPGIHVIINSL